MRKGKKIVNFVLEILIMNIFQKAMEDQKIDINEVNKNILGTDQEKQENQL